MISVILALTFLIYSYNTVMPRVSYIKAMDVYLGVCFFFVFFSLIKLAIVKYLSQRLQVEKENSVVKPHPTTHSVRVFQFVQAMPMLHLTNDNHLLAVGNASSNNTTAAAANNAKSVAVVKRYPSAFCIEDLESGSRGLEPLRKSHTESMSPAPAQMSALTRMFRGGRQSEPRYVLCKNNLFTIHFSVSCMRNFHLVSQILFPFAFVIFCTCYFIIYMHKYTDQPRRCEP